MESVVPYLGPRSKSFCAILFQLDSKIFTFDRFCRSKLTADEPTCRSKTLHAIVSSTLSARTTFSPSSSLLFRHNARHERPAWKDEPCPRSSRFSTGARHHAFLAVFFRRRCRRVPTRFVARVPDTPRSRHHRPRDAIVGLCWRPPPTSTNPPPFSPHHPPRPLAPHQDPRSGSGSPGVVFFALVVAREHRNRSS